MDWMLLPLRRYADFQGRSRRKEYWMFVLLNVIVYIILGVLAFGVFGSAESFAQIDPEDTAAAYSLFFSGGGLLFVVWWVAVLVPTIAVGVRRLHDRNMSGWWYLGLTVASMIPLVGALAGIALFVLMLLPGTPGPNRFGADPKDPSNSEVFA